MQVSHSRIECFKKCPYQYQLRYKDKLKTYFNNDPANPLVIGTALHTGIEKDVQTAIKEYYANYPVIDDKNIEEAIKLEAVIKKCREVVPRGLFEVKVQCPEFIGYIDLLVPCGTDKNGIEWFDMYDFKYSNNTKTYLESGQLHEYKFYFERTNPNKRIRKMYFLFAPKVAIRMKYKNKTNPRDETLEEFRARIRSELDGKEPQLVEVQYDIEKVKDFMRSANECRSATQFPKQPSRLCDWCEYQKFCENGEELEIMNLPENKRRTVEATKKKKLWLYGAPFSGKTYLANEFPDPLMLNTDGNVKYVDAPFIPIKDEVTVEGRITKRTFAWQVFKDAISELEKKQNDFKTIVVDLLEDTYEYCRLFMYDQLGITHESDDSFRAWDKVRTEFLSTIKRLMNLDYENIILISHEDMSKDLTKKTGDKVTAIKPNINDKAALKIAGMVDLVARVIADEGERTLSFKNNEVIFGGGRLTMTTTTIPCDYDELCKVYDDANHPRKKKAAPAAEPEKVETATVNTTGETPETPAERPKRKSRRTVEVPAEEVTAVDDSGNETPLTELVPETAGETVTADVPADDDKPRKRRRRKKTDDSDSESDVEVG